MILIGIGVLLLALAVRTGLVAVERALNRVATSLENMPIGNLHEINQTLHDAWNRYELLTEAQSVPLTEAREANNAAIEAKREADEERWRERMKPYQVGGESSGYYEIPPDVKLQWDAEEAARKKHGKY